MKKNKETTPDSRIKGVIRGLFLRSRERAKVLKEKNYTCERCGRKGSVAKGKECKIEVHHKEGISCWKKVIEIIRNEILCGGDKLEVLCKECHKEETYK